MEDRGEIVEGYRIIDGAMEYVVIDTLTLLGLGKSVNDTGNGLAILDRKSTRLNSSHVKRSRMPSSA